MVVVYKTGALNDMIARRLVKLDRDRAGQPGARWRETVPELIQHRSDPGSDGGRVGQISHGG